MKLATLATLTALVVGHVSAAPANDVLTPTGIPATSGLPFSSLSFYTTADPSVLSALSSLISSESTAVMPFTTTQPTSAVSSTPTPTSSSPTSSIAPTNTSGARSLSLRSSNPSGVVAGVGLVLGAVAALVC